MVERQSLDLVRSRCVRPCGELRVVQGDKGGGYDACRIDGRIKRSEVGGVRDVHRPPLQQVPDLGLQSMQVDRVFEVKGCPEAIPDFGR